MTEAGPIVFVVDDDPSVRRAIKRLVGSIGLWQVGLRISLVASSSISGYRE